MLTPTGDTNVPITVSPDVSVVEITDDDGKLTVFGNGHTLL